MKIITILFLLFTTSAKADFLTGYIIGSGVGGSEVVKTEVNQKPCFIELNVIKLKNWTSPKGKDELYILKNNFKDFLYNVTINGVLIDNIYKVKYCDKFNIWNEKCKNKPIEGVKLTTTSNRYYLLESYKDIIKKIKKCEEK